MIGVRRAGIGRRGGSTSRCTKALSLGAGTEPSCNDRTRQRWVPVGDLSQIFVANESARMPAISKQRVPASLPNQWLD